MADQGATEAGTAKPITIKKYANRRLYNTATSSYVTLDHLCRMVKDGQDFVVFDAKSGDDITHSVLTQIIVEEEAKGESLLPTSFLRQLIAFYGDNMQWMVPRYLEQAMGAFSSNQDQMRSYMRETLGTMFPFSQNLEEMGKQNVAMLERAVKMFSPFPENGQGMPGVPPAGASAKPGQAPSEPENIQSLKEKVEALERQIEELTRAKS